MLLQVKIVATVVAAVVVAAVFIIHFYPAKLTYKRTI
jgi:cytochrome b subunit of formate dehydrogenase